LKIKKKMSFRNLVLFAILLVFLQFFLVDSKVTTSSLPSCGFVFDGSKPVVDISHQASTSVIRANWFGFDGFVPPPVKGSTGSSTKGSTGSSTKGKRSLRGFEAQGSTGSSSTGSSSTGSSSTGSSSTGSSSSKIQSFDGITYEVAVISEKEALAPILASGPNATNADRCRSSAGNFGVPDTVQFTPATPDVLVGTNGLKVYEWKSPHVHLVRKVTYFVIVKATHNGVSVFSNSNGVIAGDPSSSSDDHEFPAFKAGLIAMGIAIYCLLLLLLLIILIAVGAGKKDDKYTTTVHRNENVEKV